MPAWSTLSVVAAPCYDLMMAFRFEIVRPPPRPLSPAATARKYGLSKTDAVAIANYVAREVRRGRLVERVVSEIGKAKKESRSLPKRKARTATSKTVR